MRYWHPDTFRDEEVRNLHYIVDKPRSKRTGLDCVVGHLGRDEGGRMNMRCGSWKERAKARMRSQK
jgi:hypothetical protein